MTRGTPDLGASELWIKWRDLRNMLVHGQAPLDERLRRDLFELQNRVRLSLLDELERAAALSPDDPRVRFVLDVLAALSVSEPDDPSHPWARANLLADVGRHLEAAEDFMVAMDRFDAEHSEGSSLSGDEDDWASTALYQAVKNLALGGQVLAAAALLPRLDADDHDELRALIDETPLPAAAG